MPNNGLARRDAGFSAAWVPGGGEAGWRRAQPGHGRPGALYPRLSVGGYVSVDDWGAVASCRSAVKDSRVEPEIDDPITRNHWPGAQWQRRLWRVFVPLRLVDVAASESGLRRNLELAVCCILAANTGGSDRLVPPRRRTAEPPRRGNLRGTIPGTILPSFTRETRGPVGAWH